MGRAAAAGDVRHPALIRLVNEREAATPLEPARRVVTLIFKRDRWLPPPVLFYSRRDSTGTAYMLSPLRPPSALASPGVALGAPLRCAIMAHLCATALPRKPDFHRSHRCVLSDTAGARLRLRCSLDATRATGRFDSSVRARDCLLPGS
jgi:hypothetical protein